MDNIISANDAYNARHKTPSEVARDFIPSPEFGKLLRANNCILVGPRGSGKTTYLKMMQPQAMKNWLELQSVKEDAGAVIGIFVAADVRWAKQLELVTKNIKNDDVRDLMHEASFVNFLGISFIDAVEKAIQTRLVKSSLAGDGELNRAAEAELAHRISNFFLVKSAPPSFSSFKHALRVRQSEMPKICFKLSQGYDYDEVESTYPYLGLSWIDIITACIDTVGEVVFTPEQRWAVLIDELEIVPAGLLNRLLQPLRSTSGNILFKYALSPTGAASKILSSHDETDPTQGNDYTTVPLWHNTKDHAKFFTRQLFWKALVDKGLVKEAEDIVRALGMSGFSADEESGKTDEKEKPESTIEDRKRAFSSLKEKDESFQDFLFSKKIQIEGLNTSDNTVSGTLVRKITPLVNMRNHVLKKWTIKEGAKKRSKIGLQPYLHYPNLLELTEGNPRWTLNLAECIAFEAQTKGGGIASQGVQRKAVDSFVSRFSSMLEVYPVGGEKVQFTLRGFLKKLSEFLHAKICLDKFSPDPALSFVVDREAADTYGDLILLCIHLGALVITDLDSNGAAAFVSGRQGLVGRKVRICYRLAPEWFLPLRTGRSVTMSRVFSDKKLKNHQEETYEHRFEENAKPTDKPQLDLF
ncbi:hypothetical protein [Franzmannia qiaohouensis]|uniref:Uncharacterized protein n=1 Tax=Franzmannia qiaohouensis TaxID=1329370 RepID=A0ABU1HJA0_9GAMM|nr:hypothetical protein [Halomonas qiaohouensis]MDR5907566.1 hypothetical protein [Halomonas qiaohouensis]